MVLRRAILAMLAVLSLADGAAAQAVTSAVDPSIGKVEVTLDLPKDKPYVGEMILLHMRAFVRADIVLDEIKQPPLINFNWQQLGRDKPIQAMVDGFSVAGVERELAIFPQQSGRLIIDPFTRHVTIVNAENQRVQADFASKPIYVDVQNYTAINPPGAWWLPAKALTMTDSWAPEPDEIQPGTLARRTIVVEAVGVTGERLPPPPDMRAPGIIAFKGPELRETIITEDGPIGRGTYRWDLRTVSSSPAKLPSIHIPWYDTSERRMRDAAVPERWVAYVGTFVHASHETARTWLQRYLSPGPVVAGVAGFAWTAALVGFVLTARRPLDATGWRRHRALTGLRRAARADDDAAFRTALVDLARADPARWAYVSNAPRVAPGLAALDAACYGRGGGVAPPLRSLAADIRREWSARADHVAASDDALPPIDGDIARPALERGGRATRFE